MAKKEIEQPRIPENRSLLETRIKSEIPDPLEGVIEGQSRKERYDRFATEVLAKIWPQNSESGEYGDDLWRPSRFDAGDVSGYTHFSPLGKDPLNLTTEEFEAMVANLGTPDYVRVRSIPPQLLNLDTTIIPVGGSCVIETWGMKNMADINAGIADGKIDESIRPQVAKAIAEFAPTISHISGAMLTGQEAGVHYVESDMWAERLISYGIPQDEARDLVANAYERINAAVARRAKLINPDSTIINVNFDEMPIQEAVNRWFDRMKLAYDPSVRVVEVMHTYIGPEQRDILKDALQVRIETDHLTDKEKEIARNLLQRDLHVRGKQIDHGRWGSMNLPKEVILGQREMTPDERAKFDTDYPYRMGVMIMRDVRDTHIKGEANAVYVGFADIPGPKNYIQHESRHVGVDFVGVPGTEEFANSLQASLTTAERLHRGNVDEHLEFLKKYTIDVQIARRELIDRKNTLLTDVSPVLKMKKDDDLKLSNTQRGLEKADANIAAQQAVLDFADYLVSPSAQKPSEAILQTAKTLKEQRTRVLGGIQKKPAENLADEDKQDLEQLPEIIKVLEAIEQDEEKPVLSNQAHKAMGRIVTGTSRELKRLHEDKTRKEAELLAQQDKIAWNQQLVDHIQPIQEQIQQIDAEIKQLGVRSYFPLSDNPFVHHAMQFLWDPDFAAFLQKAVATYEPLVQVRRERSEIEAPVSLIRAEEEEKKRNGGQVDASRIKKAEEAIAPRVKELKQKETQGKPVSIENMRGLMEQIYPKLEAYIKYLYGHTDYPTEMRKARLVK